MFESTLDLFEEKANMEMEELAAKLEITVDYLMAEFMDTEQICPY